MSAVAGDPYGGLGADERATLAAIADRLIPAAHGMPSAADVLDDDWCAACVISGCVIGTTPPKFKLSMEGPDVSCSL